MKLTIKSCVNIAVFLGVVLLLIFIPFFIGSPIGNLLNSNNQSILIHWAVGFSVICAICSLLAILCFIFDIVKISGFVDYLINKINKLFNEKSELNKKVNSN